MTLLLPTADATRELGQRLGRALRSMTGPPQVIALNGELGAGKTTFVAGVLSGMDIHGPVRSPTFTLIEPFESGTRRIYHLDLYRLAGAQDLEALGLRDLHDADHTLLIEWAERGAGGLPPVDLSLQFRYAPGDAASAGDTPRQLEVEAHTPVGLQLLPLFAASCL